MSSAVSIKYTSPGETLVKYSKVVNEWSLTRKASPNSLVMNEGDPTPSLVHSVAVSRILQPAVLMIGRSFTVTVTGPTSSFMSNKMDAQYSYDNVNWVTFATSEVIFLSLGDTCVFEIPFVTTESNIYFRLYFGDTIPIPAGSVAINPDGSQTDVGNMFTVAAGSFVMADVPSSPELVTGESATFSDPIFGNNTFDINNTPFSNNALVAISSVPTTCGPVSIPLQYYATLSPLYQKSKVVGNTVDVTMNCKPSFGLSTISASTTKTISYTWDLTRTAAPLSITVPQGGSSNISHEAIVTCAGISTSYSNTKATVGINYSGISGNSNPQGGKIQYAYSATPTSWIDGPTVSVSLNTIAQYDINLSGYGGQSTVYFQLVDLSGNVLKTTSGIVSSVQINVDDTVSFTDTVLPTMSIPSTGVVGVSTSISASVPYSSSVCGSHNVNYTSVIKGTSNNVLNTKTNTVSAIVDCPPSFGLTINSVGSSTETTTYTWGLTRIASPLSITIPQGGSSNIYHEAKVVAESAVDYSVPSANVTLSYSGDPINPSSNSGKIQYAFPSTSTLVWNDGQSVTLTLGVPQSYNVVLTGYSGQASVLIRWVNVATVVLDSKSAAVSLVQVSVNPTVKFTDTVLSAQQIQYAAVPTVISANLPYSSVICGGPNVLFEATLSTLADVQLRSASNEVTLTVLCPNCIREKSYWKEHPADPSWRVLPQGKDTIFFLSGTSYFNVLSVPPARNAYYILAHEYVTAQMNIFSGAVMSEVVGVAFSDAKRLFKTLSPADTLGLKGSSDVRKKFILDADALSGYNEGEEGPQVCMKVHQ